MARRAEFDAIVSGWMLVDDVEAIGDKIDEAAAWTKLNGPLLPDEEATVKMMIECQIAKGIERGDFEPFIYVGRRRDDDEQDEG